VVSVALAGLTFAVFCISVSVGDFSVPLADVVPAIFGFGSSSTEFIVQTLRLPRALAAVLVGAAFGLSGSVFQSVAHNPLASPDIIGITAGASAGAVVVIVITGGSSATVALAALGGALAVTLAVYVLAWRKGLTPYRLVLVGVGLGELLLAVIAWMLTRAQVADAQRATVWLTGSLNGRSWAHVRPLMVALLVLVPLLLALSRPLRLLQLGDDTASGLGIRVERSRIALITVAVGLVGVGTATAGPIAFVAFLSGPIARRLVRSPVTLIPSALVGALVVVTADLAARRLFAPSEVPVGVLTAVIGAPYLLWLLARANRTGRGA